MAEKVTGETNLKRGRKTIYDWDTWTNGEEWHLIRGEDYEVSDASMRRSVSSHAQRHGLLATTSKTDRGLVVRFSPAKRLKIVRKFRKSLPRP